MDMNESQQVAPPAPKSSMLAKVALLVLGFAAGVGSDKLSVKNANKPFCFKGDVEGTMIKAESFPASLVTLYPLGLQQPVPVPLAEIKKEKAADKVECPKE